MTLEPDQDAHAKPPHLLHDCAALANDGAHAFGGHQQPQDRLRSSRGRRPVWIRPAVWSLDVMPAVRFQVVLIIPPLDATAAAGWGRSLRRAS